MSEEIAHWDGKSADAIKAIYLDWRDHAELTGLLVALMAMPDRERGASWMMKHHLEQGDANLEPVDALAFHQAGVAQQHWEARLHYLQSLNYVHVPERSRTLVQAFLKQGIEAEQKFIRAWSYNGLYLLACQFPDLQGTVQYQLEEALESEDTGSVKARIRKGLKRGFPERG
ncbi:hypothetical protein [Aestuariispira insulae]|uniref:DNA alkylation repair enzyme n=1 Tax=Aestuariispira insulae TaxID=1461337 RepID=A0A3D9HS04_9PROT|nr:hypothetical protein [Aestuariispira insulae]RED52274.1 hypothetical protein DFP90_102292 [Aestuariispira insulae]